MPRKCVWSVSGVKNAIVMLRVDGERTQKGNGHDWQSRHDDEESKGQRGSQSQKKSSTTGP